MKACRTCGNHELVRAQQGKGRGEGLLKRSGCEITKIIWFPNLFQAFRMKAENLSISKTLIFTGCPFRNPYVKIGFPNMFLGVPETRKLSNFAPCHRSKLHFMAISGPIQSLRLITTTVYPMGM